MWYLQHTPRLYFAMALFMWEAENGFGNNKENLPTYLQVGIYD